MSLLRWIILAWAFWVIIRWVMRVTGLSGPGQGGLNGGQGGGSFANRSGGKRSTSGGIKSKLDRIEDAEFEDITERTKDGGSGARSSK